VDRVSSRSSYKPFPFSSHWNSRNESTRYITLLLSFVYSSCHSHVVGFCLIIKLSYSSIQWTIFIWKMYRLLLAFIHVIIIITITYDNKKSSKFQFKLIPKKLMECQVFCFKCVNYKHQIWLDPQIFSL